MTKYQRLTWVMVGKVPHLLLGSTLLEEDRSIEVKFFDGQVLSFDGGVQAQRKTGSFEVFYTGSPHTREVREGMWARYLA